MKIFCCKNCKYSGADFVSNGCLCAKHNNRSVILLQDACDDYEYDSNKYYWKLSKLAACLCEPLDIVYLMAVFLGWGPGSAAPKYDKEDSQNEILLTPLQAITLKAILGAHNTKEMEKIVHAYRKYGSDGDWVRL